MSKHRVPQTDERLDVNSAATPPTGRIFEIQRFSIHDGPGIRTTVFLKGCPLRCVWCHNPEGVSPQKQISFVAGNCIGCGYCFRACPRQAHRMDPEAGHVLERERCEVCGSCTEECYAKALELVGRDVSVAEVLDEVLRERPFYETSGGGLTLSGGEPTFQLDFSRALLEAARASDLNTCVETCGLADWAKLAAILPLVDLFLFDYKETDPERHREYTGAPIEPILENLRMLHRQGTRVRLRCPIIPGVNDRPDHFAGIAALARELPELEGVELMPYHRLGESKAGRFGIDAAARADSAVPEKATVESWVAELRKEGVKMV